MDFYKPESGLDGLFQAFVTDQWAVVREAVDQAGTILKQGGLETTIHASLGERMVALAGHNKWEVRKALAHACLYLRHESFDRIIAILGQDDHALVRNAARRTLSCRSDLSRKDIMKEQHGDRMLGWLQDLESKHGPMAKNAAKRVSEKLQHQFVKELNHEIVKVISPLDTSLENIQIALNQPRLNRDAIKKHTDRAQERLKFMSSVLNSLQVLTQNVDVEHQTENLLSMLEETVHLVRDRNEKNRALSAEIDIDPDIVIEANRHLLLQALSNIVQNSIDSYGGQCGQQPTVQIGATVENDSRVILSITDQGCGMSDETVRYAFQLFATSKADGTGVGLTIAKKIIESDHAGLVHLSSGKEDGTTVTVALPIKQEEWKW